MPYIDISGIRKLLATLDRLKWMAQAAFIPSGDRAGECEIEAEASPCHLRTLRRSETRSRFSKDRARVAISLRRRWNHALMEGQGGGQALPPSCRLAVLSFPSGRRFFPHRWPWVSGNASCSILFFLHPFFAKWFIPSCVMGHGIWSYTAFSFLRFL